MGRTSIKQLSEIIGLSPTTVSMVLNGRADEFKIAKKTQARILEVAKKHKYIPNIHARSLRNKTSNIVGLIIPTLTNRFFSEMAETFEHLARSDGKFALMTVTQHDRKKELEATNYFISQKADCIFTSNPTALGEVSDLCTDAGVKQIILDAPKGIKDTVSTDNFNAARILTHNILVAMEKYNSKDSIYYIGGWESHTVSNLRFQGFRRALEERGKPCPNELFIESDFNTEAAYQAARKLFKKTSSIGGLFVNSLQTMEGVIQLFSEGITIDPEICLGVFDYHPFISFMNLNVISVKQDAGRMMQIAYERYSDASDMEEPSKAFFSPHQIIYSPKALRG